MHKEFPESLPIKKLLGPSFVILALGLGSGEVILWPYMASNYGLGIAWGALIGITFQYFINMEIERYALVKGESVFVGLGKIFKWIPWWFIASTFIGFGLPGIIAASAKVFSGIFGITDFKWTAIAFLLVIGLILSAGKTVYGMMERLTKTILLIGVPFIFVLALAMAHGIDWIALFKGFAGIGNGFMFLPKGIDIAVFLAAFAYAGAGGNLNLTQSIYIKEKGYGMGKYASKIAGLFRAEKGEAHIKLSGESFELNEKNIGRFKKWWRAISIEHLIVFWFIGALSMSLLMLLSYATVYGGAGNASGINFVILEGAKIGERFVPIVGTLFLFAVSVMLFQTQLGVADSTSRIMAENFAVWKLKEDRNGKVNLSKFYHAFVWLQIAFGVALFLLNIYEPKELIVLGAVINAIAMFIHTAFVFILNHRELPKVFRPSMIRKAIIGLIFLFFGFFSIIVIVDNVRKIF